MQPRNRFDFHCHSNLSDGYFAPEQLARKLADAGVHYAALTDHENIAGFEAFQRAARARGMVAVAGVELRGDWRGTEPHLLAFGFDPAHPELPGLFGQARPIPRIVETIHAAGGLVFLAHPLQLSLEWEELDDQIGELRALGIDGIEAFYKNYTPAQREQLQALADKHDLLCCAGSDFHGPGLAGARSPGIAMPTPQWKKLRDALGAGLGNGDAAEGPPRPAPTPKLDWSWFFLRIVLPALVVVVSFVSFLFLVLIPTMESSLLDRKRETIRELTNSAWSILDEYHTEVQAGLLTREEAQRAAIERIKYLRYGIEGKDYFWITDMQPRMVMHPYREDLNNQDLSDFRDPAGVPLFVEFVRLVREQDHGYLDYVWQWKDDPERLEAKESYVRGFEPWGWVIGTGIYMEDVQKEIGAITGRVVNFSLFISIASALLLLVVVQQSLRVERRRLEAERDLRESHEKYRTLVEAATEGTLMVIDGRCSFANRTMLDMLGYSAEELSLLDLHDLFPEQQSGQAVERLLDPETGPKPLELPLRRKDGSTLEVVLTPVRFGTEDSRGLILNARDIDRHKAVEEQLGASKARYRALTEAIDIGVFRVQLEDPGAILEINAAGRRILGIAATATEPPPLSDLLAEPQALDKLRKSLVREGAVRDQVLQVARADGGMATLSLSAVAIADEEGNATACDGLLVDVTERRRRESERENLVAQLQSSLLFLSEPVSNAVNELVSCPMSTSIAEAARLMSEKNFSAIAITAESGEVIGLVTDHDLRERALARSIAPERPVYEIMSAPVADIPDWAPVYEAFIRMREQKLRHLLVRSSAGKINGMIRHRELLRLDRYSAVVLSREIQSAPDLTTLARCRERLPTLVGSLIDSGALPRNTCRIVTDISDGILERVIGFALEKLGPAPQPFAFLVFGSEGREEQTLKTDQDNALVYETPPAEMEEQAAAYFLDLGREVCQGLHATGCEYCPGEMMASNPKWNLPLDAWREQFGRWIAQPESEELLRFNIVFDFRCMHGEAALAQALRAHIHQTLRKRPDFFQFLARNLLHYRAPLGFFGQIMTGGERAGSDRFNIKDAMLPIVNFARLYALQAGIEEGNTFDRIQQLQERGILREDQSRELSQAYGALMQLRLRHQLQALKDGRQPDNAINPKSLSQIESGLLKQALNQVGMVQKKVSFDYTGSA